ncbi:hypothetical protein BJX76DRAFT_366088 [Aspergillus varians]
MTTSKRERKPRISEEKLKVQGFKVCCRQTDLDRLLKDAGLHNTTLDDMEPGYLSSGSTVSEKQHLLLHAIHPPLEGRKSFVRSLGLYGLQEQWEEAKNLVKGAKDLGAYLAVIQRREWICNLGRGDEDWPKAFQPAHDLQEQVVVIRSDSTMLESIKIDLPAQHQTRLQTALDTLKLGGKKRMKVAQMDSAGDDQESGHLTESDGAGAYVEDTAYQNLKPADDEVVWTLDHINLIAKFQKTGYTARTDGGLRQRVKPGVLAIIETKARLRSDNYKSIAMQEAAEMAAWIKSGRPSPPLLTNGRLLLSQDRHQVFLTVGQYEPDANATLIMRSYGPWNTLIKGHMEELVAIIVAIVLKALSLVT